VFSIGLLLWVTSFLVDFHVSNYTPVWRTLTHCFSSTHTIVWLQVYKSVICMHTVN